MSNWVRYFLNLAFRFYEPFMSRFPAHGLFWPKIAIWRKTLRAKINLNRDFPRQGFKFKDEFIVKDSQYID